MKNKGGRPKGESKRDTITFQVRPETRLLIDKALKEIGKPKPTMAEFVNDVLIVGIPMLLSERKRQVDVTSFLETEAGNRSGSVKGQ